jgi:histidinol dehydrogenase
VAADLLSQAEHDADAFVVVVTDDPTLAKAVDAEVARQAKLLPRGEILSGSLPRAVGFLVKDMEEGAAVVDRIAPEHLSVMTRSPERSLAAIRNAGTAFLGPWSPVAVGDYLAGINHTLPTGGAARFSSPLGVANFLRRTNVVSYRREALEADAPHVTRLAEHEGLVAHAEAVRVRTGSRRGK